MKQPQCIPCDGVSPKTGRPVGSRHKWSAQGVCEYCNRTYGQVHGGKMFTPKFVAARSAAAPHPAFSAPYGV